MNTYPQIALEDADYLLHDAVLDVFSFEIVDGVFRFSGFVEDGWGRRSGRFRVRGEVHDARRFWLEDETGTGLFFVEGIRHDLGVICFLSPLPAQLFVESNASTLTLARDSEPFSVRRWWRWRDVESERVTER